MKKIGIFYGSTTGTTAKVAELIAKELNVAPSDIHDVAKSAPGDVAPYDLLILGSSTWGSGDMQDDWYDFADGLQVLDLRDKEIALFGCGDEAMSDTFCSAVGELYRRLKDTGARFIAPYPADCYDFTHTEAEVNGRTVGLLVDDVNRSEITGKRVQGWCSEIRSEI